MNDRLREERDKAVKRLEEYEALPEITGPAMPGDVYIVPHLETGVNLMVVRQHPDYDILFVIPADWINEFLGSTDIKVSEEFWGGESLILRCGQGNWVERKSLEKHLRTRIRLPEQFVSEARKILADLARGRPMKRGPDVEDPELWAWYEEIEHDIADAVAIMDGNRP